METKRDEVGRREILPRWITLALVVLVAGLAVLVASGRRRVEVSLWNDTGETLRNVRLTYSIGEDQLDEIAPGAKLIHSFRPGLASGPGDPKRYEATVSCDLADGQTVTYPLGSTDIKYWARRHVRVTRHPNGVALVFGYEPRSSLAAQGHRWLSNLLNFR